MSSSSDDPDTLPEADRVSGAPHPRHASRVIGQDHAIDDFLDAARAGRLHHAWLLTGPRGVGKATLAWAMARWLLAGGGESGLSVPDDDATVRRIRALSEPRLMLVRRPWDEKAKRLRADITVEEIRKLLSFFHMSAAEGGHRVAIIDAADEMNTAAANALLKVLEEPPKGGIIIMVAHQPARLLPTIRSRCRELRLTPLDHDDMAQVMAGVGVDAESDKLAELSGGSAGEALRLLGQDGLAVYQQIVDLFATLPRIDRPAALKLAEQAGARASGDGDPFDLTVTLLDRFLTRAARAGLMGAPLVQAATGEAELLARIAPDDRAARHWAQAQAELSARARSGRAVNLDGSALVLDMLTRLAHNSP